MTAHSVAVFSCCPDIVCFGLVKCEHLIISYIDEQYGGSKLTPAWTPVGLNKGNERIF